MSKKIIFGISSKHLFVYGITLLISSRALQMAEHSILQAYLGVWGPLQEKGPQGPSFLRLSKPQTASPMGRWPRRGQRGP